MYKLLLCWRYLLTRYLALACIVSVMLGVATLIVVNSVMGGFSTKLRDRLHGLLSDVLIETLSFEGFPDPKEKMDRIRQDPFLKDKVEEMTPTLDTFAMILFHFGSETIARPVRLIGIDPKGRARVGGFAEHLINQKNSPEPTFKLSPEAKRRHEEREKAWAMQQKPIENQWLPGEPPPPEPPPIDQV